MHIKVSLSPADGIAVDTYSPELALLAGAPLAAVLAVLSLPVVSAKDTRSKSPEAATVRPAAKKG